MPEFSQSQLLRLKYIDFCLMFFGKSNRKALMDRFSISSAASTRDLSLYKEQYSKNITYDKASKEYRVTKDFKPAYSHDALESLKIIANDIGVDGTKELEIICESPTQINNPDLNILSKITQAIYQKKPIELNYCSLSSGSTKRIFVPHALVNNGLRWHIRGYDRKRKGFRDFVINRIQKAQLLLSDTIHQEETKDHDIQWNRIVEMEIIPHPNIKHKEVIEHEFEMKNGVLKVNARAAVVGYFLRRWNIDCSPDHQGSSTNYHLWLKNNLSLYGVSNLKLAPLYTPPNE